MESEEFDQGKKEKVEDVYTKSREIVNSKALEFFLKIIEKYSHLMPSQFYPQRIQEVEAMYSEVDQVLEPLLLPLKTYMKKIKKKRSVIKKWLWKIATKST